MAKLLAEFEFTQTVIDPVMIATTGARLLEHEAIQSFIHSLLPKSLILTPNIQEAKLLLAESRGVQMSDIPEITGIEDMKRWAIELQGLGPQYVLVKGGHVPLDDQLRVCDPASRSTVADVLTDGTNTTIMTSVWSPTRNTHGTGCTLASAIACNLALKHEMHTAVSEAISYVHGAIIHSFDLGSGNGPLNHMYRQQVLPFTPGHFVEYLINHPSIKPAWQAYTEHIFVSQLADGSLPLSSFKRFLQQDYLYLIQYARLTALAAYKCENLDDIAASAEIILHIREEMKLHVNYCKDFGITKAMLEAGQESVACTVYTRYIESIGNTRDWMSLQIALAACLIGYGEVGKRLSESSTTKRDSVYWSWIKNYAEDDYSSAVTRGRALVEKHAKDQSPSRFVELIEIFRRVTEYEALFWTDAMQAAGTD
ncbi:putative Thiamin biosynthesis protein [Taphrina deformans PYCC 5710]|uniref:Thiamin biosynthesis protein n=1 Tax=Taphrina deformans (strain PYCC 5710 / ATCC 11124 / CBS 356.35 / IMI 108563 / JCM 9778 / NBRC 8474) TaxID=1097556 RepID=R4XHH0_TAPDE|nr:putative Thiamin biosynthesis protein [Taphrina deformans PYCC 5710]|eukprot:CCG82862.1 putative Thiamin biosynthesis protein [Taphrina deformans PYCC 5710]